jgi:hypothetical protein
LEIAGLRTVFDDGRHNAFTDLAWWRDSLWVVFRTATSHDSDDGAVMVLRSDDCGRTFSVVARLSTELDDRDPKLLPLDDRLLVYACGHSAGRFVPEVAASADGVEWSPLTPIYKEGVWLWRPRRFWGRVWCAAYHIADPDDRSTWHVDLLRSRDGITWKKHATVVEDHCPTECDLWMDESQVMWIVVRRDAGPGTALLARAASPYHKFRTWDLATVVQGPVVKSWSDWVVIAGRAVNGSGARRTAVWSLTFADDGSPRIQSVLGLPSGGDTSYPGITAIDGELYITYYSEHESVGQPGYRAGCGPSRIYFARIDTDE